MPPERAERLQQLFEQALSLDPGARLAFLDHACAGDAALRRELEGLLAADVVAEAGAFMQTDLLGLASGAFEEPVVAGQRIGPYRLVRELGQGGMGRVYLAERDDVGKAVAIKLMRDVLAGPEVVRRFLFERRVLARLDHPHVARLLDAGTTDARTPYLVMEYVEGEPITPYCERARLPVRARLRLFLDVCEALQYAHRNLVIHRDLKPSNILVIPPAAGQPGYGTVKLLDFGIAKLLEAQDDDAALLTQTGMRVMTPGYAAPEQVRGGAITTATDVYALGVVLYELLAGQRPYEVRGRSMSEIERIICEEEPARPSILLSRVQEQSRRTGAAPRSELEHLRRVLAGDLDTIVLKALRKDPTERYLSVELLAEDVRRYLAGRPVLARPQTGWYRLQKFTQRHRAAVAAAGLLALLLGGFTLREGRLRAAAEAARDAARQEAEKSEEVVAFLVDLFDVSDPYVAQAVRGDTITARTLLARSAARVEQELAGQPDVQAKLLDALGRVYTNLGLYAEAEPLLAAALRRREEQLPATDPERVESLHHLAWLHHLRGDFPGADSLYRAAIAHWRRYPTDDPAKEASLLSDFALNLRARADYPAAESLHREALARWRRVHGPEHLDVSNGLNNLAMTLAARGDAAAAESLFRQTLTERRRILGEHHPNVAIDLNNLGDVLSRQGRFAEAEAYYREALALNRQVHGERHPEITQNIESIAVMLVNQGRAAEAEPLLRQALAMQQSLTGPEHPRISNIQNNLGRALREQGRYPEAERFYQSALDLRRRVLGDDHPLVATSLNNLAGLLYDRGQIDAAIPLYREALRRNQERYPNGHPNVYQVQSNLAGCLVLKRAYEEAEALLLESYPALRASLGDAHPNTERARERLVALYEAWNRPREAARYRAARPDE